MISFMFAVLGSTLFWVIFFIVGFFAGCLTLRFIAPKTYKIVTEEHRVTKDSEYKWDDELSFAPFFILIGIFLFWPIVLIFTFIRFLIGKIFFPLLCKTIKTTASIVPEFEIKTK